MPYDYLGTFTQNQLRERNAYLKSQVYALPSIIETKEAQIDRIGSLIVQDSAENTSITSEVAGKTYALHSTQEPAFRGGSEIEALHHAATNSRFPIRFDRLTGNYSHGDYVWRSGPRLLQSGDLDGNGNMDLLSEDDSIPAQRAFNVVTEFKGVSKRPNAIEDKVMKLQYRFLTLSDEIERKKATLHAFTEELAAMEGFLNNEVVVTAPDGTTRTETDYPTAGVDLESSPFDVTSPEDVERLYELFLAPFTEPTNEEQNPQDLLLPADYSIREASAIGGTNEVGSVAEFLVDFPIPGYNIPSGNWRLDMMANVYKYGYLNGIMVPIEDSDSMSKSKRGGGGPYKYLPPNVLSDLQAFADEIYSLYGVHFRITEAWPATVIHSSIGHYTGNCVDVALDYGAEASLREGLTLPDLAEAIKLIGIQKGYIHSGLNEYAQESRHSTAPHLHLNCNVRYFNEALFMSLAP